MSGMFLLQDFNPCLLLCLLGNLGTGATYSIMILLKQYTGSTVVLRDDPPLGNESPFGLAPLQHLLMVGKPGQVCFTGKDDTGGQRVPYERNLLPPD